MVNNLQNHSKKVPASESEDSDSDSSLETSGDEGDDEEEEEDDYEEDSEKRPETDDEGRQWKDLKLRIKKWIFRDTSGDTYWPG